MEKWKGFMLRDTWPLLVRKTYLNLFSSQYRLAHILCLMLYECYENETIA